MRAVLKKGFFDWLAAADPDVAMLQETKAHPDQLPTWARDPEGHEAHWNWSKGKKGYSGTACLCKRPPLSVSFGLKDMTFQGEGRVIRLEYEDFFLYNIYFPNGQMSEERLTYKLGFYDAFLDEAQALRKTKPVVVGGDFNTAHTEIDLKNPKSNADRSGFLPIEREWIDTFIDHGFVDCFRLFESEGGHYTWWTYRFNARANNAGWRIDSFFVSEELKSRVVRMWHEPEVMGSDHCPIGIEIAD